LGDRRGPPTTGTPKAEGGIQTGERKALKSVTDNERQGKERCQGEHQDKGLPKESARRREEKTKTKNFAKTAPQGLNTGATYRMRGKQIKYQNNLTKVKPPKKKTQRKKGKKPKHCHETTQLAATTKRLRRI